jgi:alpha-beta hydrolase superfamily lysophospholipase
MLRALVLIGGLGLVPAAPGPVPTEFTLKAADGVVIYARAWAAEAPGAPTILLFHQAGSSKSEYAPLGPRLAELGYNALAIDQRSGGDLYQPPNETVQHLGRSEAYPAVLPDMEAALAWARQTHPHAPIYAWGSSYSAALVFALAARHPHEIDAVIAFSPGEYLDDKHFVRDAAKRVRVPVFIDSAADADEERSARAIYDAVAASTKEDYVPKAGIHGASTLRADRDPDGAAENWTAVTAFLAKLPGPRP